MAMFTDIPGQSVFAASDRPKDHQGKHKVARTCQDDLVPLSDVKVRNSMGEYGGGLLEGIDGDEKAMETSVNSEVARRQKAHEAGSSTEEKGGSCGDFPGVSPVSLFWATAAIRKRLSAGWDKPDLVFSLHTWRAWAFPSG